MSEAPAVSAVCVRVRVLHVSGIRENTVQAEGAPDTREQRPARLRQVEEGQARPRDSGAGRLVAGLLSAAHACRSSQVASAVIAAWCSSQPPGHYKGCTSAVAELCSFLPFPQIGLDRVDPCCRSVPQFQCTPMCCDHFVPRWTDALDMQPCMRSPAFGCRGP